MKLINCLRKSNLSDDAKATLWDAVNSRPEGEHISKTAILHAEAMIENLGKTREQYLESLRAEYDKQAEYKANLIERYRVYERELRKKLDEHGGVGAAETHALAASGLMQEGVAAARFHLGLPNTMKPGTPLMEREKKEKEGQGRSASEIAASAATHGVKGIGEAISGLHELFGGKSLKSFPGGIDEDTYAKAKPHFEKALAEFQAAGKDIKEFVRWAYESFSAAIKPYLRRFIAEKKGIKPEPGKKGDLPTPDAPKGWNKVSLIGMTVYMKADASYSVAVNHQAGTYDLSTGIKALDKNKIGSFETLEDAIAATEKEITEIEEPENAGAAEEEGGEEEGGEIEIEVPGEKGDKKRKKKKRIKKMKDVGEELGGKRASMDHTERTEAISLDLDTNIKTDAEPKQIVAALKKMTTKANLLKVDHGVEGRTPGTIRFLAAFRQNLLSWTEREGRRRGGSTGKYRRSYEQALATTIEYGGENAQKELKASAAAYISILERLDAMLKDVTKVREARTKIFWTLYKADQLEKWVENPTQFASDVYRFSPLHEDHANETGVALNNYVRKKAQLHYLLWKGWATEEAIEDEADKDQPIRRVGVGIFDIETPDKYRKGKDKKGEDLMATFGLRGVDYGNWAEADFRQRSVNLTYDSFMMLAEVLGAPLKGISLNETQRLGIGYGARGRGGHTAAAFWPSNSVIGLTKTKGDGSLAHEWGHAFDFMTLTGDMALEFEGMHYSAIDDLKHALKYRYEIENLEATVEKILRGLYLNSGLKSKRLDDAKKFLKEKWESKLVKKTTFFDNAIGLDGGFSGKYWSKPEELWARSFEAWVADQLQGDNLYLVDTEFAAPGQTETRFNREHGAYPTEEERERFNDIFNHFFDGIEWTDEGVPKLKKDYQPVTLYEKAQAQAAIDEMLKRVDELYAEIYQGQPSDDGLYWYAYTQTTRGELMQPKGFVAYDDAYKYEAGEGEAVAIGQGAVAYENVQQADEIIRFGLKALIHNQNDNKIYLEAPDGTTDTTRTDGEITLEEASPDDVSTSATEGGATQGPVSGPRAGEGLTGGAGDTERPPPRGGVGDSDLEVHIDAEREGDEDVTDRSDAVQPAEPIDYAITTTDELTTRGAAERFANNLAAIRALKQIEGEDRKATEDEQRILVKYNGWGELGGALEGSRWASSQWRGRAAMVEEILTRDEIIEIRPSTMNAYYTPPGVINNIYQSLMRFGFKGGRVLEPSVGIGHFFGMMPEEMRRQSSMTGIDRDPISARIAGQLYQNASIIHKRFEDTSLPDNFYDLTISNVPFGDERIHDRKHNPLNFVVHDYFINKMINVTKPGGLIVAITSTGTMDKSSTAARNMWDEQVDFIGAVRLPNGIYSGAQAGSDVIFMRKKAENVPHIKRQEWVDTEKKEMPSLDSNFEANGYNWQAAVNKYFLKNDSMVLGTMGYYNGYRNTGVHVTGNPETIDADMEKALRTLPANVYTREPTPDVVDIADKLLGSDTIKDGAFYIGDDGVVYQNASGGPVKQELDATKIARLKGMIGIRDVARDLLRAQAKKKGDKQLKKLRDRLNRRYDAFVKKHGPINKPVNYRLIVDDPDAGLLSALEKWEPATQRVLGKEAIFTKNTIADIVPPASAETAEESLIYSQAWRGRVDLNYMAGLTGKSKETLINELDGKIYDDPEKGWVTADEYLSGNVRRKLRTAEAAAKLNPKYEVNVEMLKASLPKPLEAHEIRVKLGAGWVPAKIVKEYVDALFGGHLQGLKIDFTKATGEWAITWEGRTQAQANRNRAAAQRMVQAESEYGTNRVNFFKVGNKRGILDYALNGGFPKVYDKIGTGKDAVYVLNEVQTDAANNKVAAVQQRFSDWVWEHDNRRQSRRQELEDRYNEIFNAYVDREFDGSHLSLPGKVPDEIITLRKHQKDAIWRYLQTGVAYLGHEVGTGKTFTMIGSIMEAKRLGLASKPIMAVVKSTLDQIRADFLKLYPGANVLTLHVPQNKKQRKKVLSRIATGEWDAVLVNHHSFEKIPLSPDTERELIEAEKRRMRAALEEAKANRAARYTISQIEKQIEKLEQRLRAALDRKRDDVPTFEEMGIDMIVIDEAHTHKNIPFNSQYGNVKGVQPDGSGIAQDLFFKTQYLHNRFGRGVLMASGTPLTNSVGELYNVSRYLHPKEIDRLGVSTFDAWANTFGVIRQEAEYAPSGGGFRMTSRFAEFINIPELMAMVRQSMDIKRADEINIVRPDLEGGKPQTVKVEQNDYVQSFQQVLAQRVQNYRIDGKDAMWPNKEGVDVNDNMLRIVNDGRLVAMDARLFDPKAQDYEETKTNKAVDKIYEIYKEPQDAEDESGKKYKEKKHLQLIFLDRGVPGRGFNLYADIKEKLVKKGIPAKEIVFIHDAKNDQQKITLFRKANDGKIRVMIGSTKKMGIGVNVQRRVSAMHHLDVDWTYANYEQRNGRGWRFGNTLKTVKVYNYGTTKTVDAFMWSTVAYKEKILGQVMSNDPKVRHVEDISKTSMEASEMEALLSDDPLHKEKIELEANVRQLRNIYSNFEHSRRRAEQRLTQIPHEIAAKKKQREKNKRALELAEKIEAVRIGDAFFNLKKEGGKANKAAEKVLAAEKKKLGKVGENQAVDRRIGELGHIVTEIVPTLEVQKSPKTGKKWEVHGEKEVKKFIPSVGDTLNVRFSHGFVATVGGGVSKRLSGDYLYKIGEDVKYTYDPEKGISRGLTNIVNGLEANIEELGNKIEGLNAEIPKLEELKDSKFERQEELSQKETRLIEVTRELLERQQAEDAALRERMQHGGQGGIDIEDDGTRLAMGSAPGTDVTKRTISASDLKRVQAIIPTVRAAMAEAGLPQEVLDRIDVELKPIIDLRGKDVQKTLDEWAAEGKTAAPVLGATTFRKLSALVELSLEQDLSRMDRTAYHESFHVAARWILPKGEYDRIMRHYKTEEGAAEAFADFVAKRRQPVGIARRILTKIKNILQKIGNAIRGKGFTRPQEIFGRIIEREYTPHFGEDLGVETTTAFDVRLSLGDAIRRFGRRREPQRTSVMDEVMPPHVAGRFKEAAKGITRAPVWQRLKAGLKEAVATFTPGRMFPKLDKKNFAKANEIFRNVTEASAYSKWAAAQKVEEIIGELSPEEYELFSMRLILDDLVRDMEEGGVLENWEAIVEEDGELAFGFKSKDEVESTLEKVNRKIAGSEKVKNSLAIRERFMTALRRKLVEEKLLKPQVLDDPRYFHHQVLEYANLKYGVGTGIRDIRVKKKGYQIHRIGSIKDYNTHYAQAEYEVMAQGISQLEVKKNLDEIGREFNIMYSLRAKARHKNYVKIVGGQKNYNRLEQLRGEQAEILGNSLDGKGKGLDSGERQRLGQLSEEIRELDPTMPFRSKIAMGFAKIEKELGGEEFVEEEIYDLEDGDLDFTRLSELAEQGSIGAATVLKGVSERNKFIKETLGRGFLTWQDMMREEPPVAGSAGWDVWRPKPNSAWYMVNSINDRLLQTILEGNLAAKIGTPIASEDEVRKVLARGVDVMWALPVEVIEVLDGQDFTRLMDENVVSRAAERSLNWWKRWILINPARITKYNLNNLSGDLDIVLAYDPKILKYAKQAAKDLWQLHYKPKEMSSELKAEFDVGMRNAAIGSGMTVHDIPDIGDTPQLAKLMRALDANDKSAIAYIKRFWEGSKNFTTWRENVLRLAAYRFFKDEIAARKVRYGASVPDVVDATTDPDRKAALLARELIGDYGGLSKGGQWLRRKVIPFYSWMEINAPRYYRMFRNLAVEGGPTRGRGLRAGAILGKKAAFLSAKVFMLYSAVQLFNHLFWPDEEEELGEVGRRQMHLILGRRADGSIMTLRFQGALSDALSWFNLHDFPDDIRELATGRKTVYQWGREASLEGINKIVQGARPDIKVPGEMITGRQLFPEFWRPRPVRDKWEHAARMFSLETIYRRVAGKPIRGEDVSARVLNDLASLFTYSADPGEVAYHSTRRLVSEFLEESNIEKPLVDPTTRSNALYYYKLAIKFGDAEAAQKYLEKYKELGGKMKYLRVSIKRAHPLASLPKSKRTAFYNRLTGEEKLTIKRGTEWYKRTYRGKK